MTKVNLFFVKKKSALYNNVKGSPAKVVKYILNLFY